MADLTKIIGKSTLATMLLTAAGSAQATLLESVDIGSIVSESGSSLSLTSTIQAYLVPASETLLLFGVGLIGISMVAVGRRCKKH